MTVTVQVGYCSKWNLGVVKESVERKGEVTLSSKYGIWTVRKVKYEYIANSNILSLKTKPQRIRVQLDYERGEVSFYDPSDMSHLYTYKDTFKEKMFPYFSPDTDNSDISLQICPLKLSVKKL